MSTIVALATPPGKGAIHIIRLSGSLTYEIINKLSKDPVLKTVDRVQITQLVNKQGLVIDKVVLIKFYSPDSYTGEDLIEINAHGNNLIVKLIIEEIISYGASLSKAGEFTKKALLNNKLQITDIENIKSLFAAKSYKEIFTSNSNTLSKTLEDLNEIQKQLFVLIAEAEMNIDYPPDIESNEEKLSTKMQKNIEPILQKLQKIYSLSQLKKKSNFRILIVGQPNAGKSSLINFLLQEDKIIVSNLPGTTRDSIEIDFFYKSYLLTLVDSAGIRETNDQLEKESILRTKEEIKKASLIIYLIDSSKPTKDKEITELLTNTPYFTLYSKSDLLTETHFNSISVKKKDIDALHQLLDKFLSKEYLPTGINNEFILDDLYKSISNLELALSNKLTIDLISEYLIIARDFLLKTLFIDENKTERINKIFDNFCIGK